MHKMLKSAELDISFNVQQTGSTDYLYLIYKAAGCSTARPQAPNQTGSAAQQLSPGNRPGACSFPG